jgi:hypothetical protein
MCFDRFDICDAYALFEAHYNVNGIVWERPSNQRRKESIGVQLHRLGYRNPSLSYDNMTENAQAIYNGLVNKYFSNDGNTK